MKRAKVYMYDNVAGILIEDDEGFHRQLRKVTQTKGSFTSDGALMKLLYLVQKDITAKWEKPMHNWNRVLSQLSVLYDDRLRLDL